MLRRCSLTIPRFGSLIDTWRLNHGYLTHIRPFGNDIVADWPPAIKNFLKKEGIESPTDIQKKTLPIAMSNQDLVGIARTGSGKTLAFVIPAVIKLLKEGNLLRGEQFLDSSALNKPNCLVLAPTRELANQTADVFKKFTNLGIRSIPLVGGAARSKQVELLAHHPYNVLIATPGRLQDLVDDHIVDLSDVRYLVLDEADRMLDMGFEPQLRKIVKNLPQDRQTLMYSATWPKEIQQLASSFLRDYQRIAIDSDQLKANPNIKQIVHVCAAREKLNILVKYLTDMHKRREKCLIFVNTKKLADNLMFLLMKSGIKSVTMHGNKTQRQRDDALRYFKEGKCLVMIASDVAARGLDINDINVVVNFDLPNNIEDYIHRIGRTARHEKQGTAVSLFTDSNSNIASSLLQVLRETNQEIPPKLEHYGQNRLRSTFYG